MGYIDADTHVRECADTWGYFDPGEEEYRPTLVSGQYVMQELRISERTGMERWDEVFRPGSCELTDVAARVGYMDDLGVDVHVMYPTWFLSHHVGNAVAEAAMMRSYNRWLGERSGASGGRLRWAVNVPTRAIDRALQEIEYGRGHGAAAVFIKGINHGMSIRDPYLLPIFAKAQELDLAIGLHVGAEDQNVSLQDPGLWLYTEVMPIPSAVGALLQSDLCDRFPRLRWAFLEAGSAWIPYVAQEAFRTVDIRGFGDEGWRRPAREAFAKYPIYISCQMDDDISYVADLVGDGCLVHGTDFGHLDLGSDPNGLHIIANRGDVRPDLRSRITDTNARALYQIPDDYHPAPPPSINGYAINTQRFDLSPQFHPARPGANLIAERAAGKAPQNV